MPEENNGKEEEEKDNVSHEGWVVGFKTDMPAHAGSNDPRSAVSHEQEDGNEQQDQAQSSGKTRGKDLPSMPPVELGARGQLRLILRGGSLFAIPPCAATVQVISDI